MADCTGVKGESADPQATLPAPPKQEASDPNDVSGPKGAGPEPPAGQQEPAIVYDRQTRGPGAASLVTQRAPAARELALPWAA